MPERLHAVSVPVTRTIHNLALIGFMGTGKSSVGRLVAAQMKYRFVDTDDLVESRAGKPITAIFAEDGEPAFRRLESQVLAELEPEQHLVIATGGGLAANESNLESLRKHALVVCLWATPESIWEHVKSQTHRPLLHDPDPVTKIRRLLSEREPYYRRADVLVNTERRSLRDVAQHVLYQYHVARQRSI